MIRLLNDGVSAVADAYDTFILDLWGVVHNGVRPFPEAVAAMAAMKAAGKTVLLLSNAPRRAWVAQAGLHEKLGLPEGLYDGIMTSGEAVWQHLRDRPDAFYQSLGHKAWLLGVLPADEVLFDGLDITRVDRVEDADFCINTGPQGAEARAEDYDRELAHLLETGKPMICANPDRVVHRGESLEICAGAIAERFEGMAGTGPDGAAAKGQVRWHGKPYADIYEACLALAPGAVAASSGMSGSVNRTRVLAVGDSFITDIAGANGAGIDSLLVTGGIYRDAIVADGLEAVAARENAVPTFAADALRWARGL